MDNYLDIKFVNTKTGEVIIVKYDEPNSFEKFGECMANKDLTVVFD